MSSAQARELLHKYIDLADERLIRAMLAMLENYFQADDEIMSFTTQGQPLTKDDMIKALNEAVSVVKEGKGLSSTDIRKAKKDW